MRVEKESFFHALQTIQPGLAAGLIQQSNCFVFRKGKAITYNDELCFQIPVKIDPEFEGAVDAAPLLRILDKTEEEEIEIKTTARQIILKGRNDKAKINLDKEILLPYRENVEKPGDWEKLPTNFSQSLQIIQECAGTNKVEFSMTCVHLAPDWIEASDRRRHMGRVTLGIAVPESVLVPASILKFVPSLDMTHVSTTKTWLHFKNPSGLVVSCHRYKEGKYPDLSQFYAQDRGQPIRLPKALTKNAKKANVFTEEEKDDNKVLIEIKENIMRLSGKGQSGEYEGLRKINYDGDYHSFYINPLLLIELLKRYTECFIDSKRLRVESGKFVYLAFMSKGK